MPLGIKIILVLIIMISKFGKRYSEALKSKTIRKLRCELSEIVI